MSKTKQSNFVTTTRNNNQNQYTVPVFSYTSATTQWRLPNIKHIFGPHVARKYFPEPKSNVVIEAHEYSAPSIRST